MKEVKKTTPPENFYYDILNQMKEGIYPTKIAKFLGVSKQRLNYYISSLKRQGYIKKLTKGAWEVLKDYDGIVKIKKAGSYIHSKNINNKLGVTDKIRGHAFMFNLKIPKLSNWHKRQTILDKKNISYELINRGITQRIIYKDHKIWLNPTTITIFWPSFKNYLANTAQEAFRTAFYDLQQLIKGLERHLGASFEIKRRYVFKVCRQHYSMVKNALAKQYDKDGKKLNVYTEQGLWLSIDNSYNLHELETLHPKTAKTDSQKVLNFFNGVKICEDYTPQIVMQMMGGITQNQAIFDANMKSHISAVQKLGTAVEELTKKIRELK